MTDPLDEAIEAAWCTTDLDRRVVADLVRAAAPIIERNARLRAADELEEQGINFGIYSAQQWLRRG